jgi:Tfp pilus assembly protein PilX
MINIRKQNGATLFVALVLLVMMTLFAVSSINMGTVNLKIVGNMQATKSLDAEAESAIEQVISDSTKFTSPSSTTIASTTYGNFTVDAPVCIDSQTATGYSAVNSSIIPEDNTWEVVTTVTDTVTGATSTIHAGVELRMLAGNCL